MAKGQSEAKHEILNRTTVIYVIFVLAVLLIFLRIVCVQYFSAATADQAARLKTKIFRLDTLQAHRGTIFSRDGQPLAISIFRYKVCFDFGSEGFDDDQRYLEESDSLSRLLAAYFQDKSADEYRRIFRDERHSHYSLRYRRDTVIPYATGFFGRLIGGLRGKQDKVEKIYDTLRRHSSVTIFRDIDFGEWQTLKTYPILNGSLGMTSRLEKNDERVFPGGNIALRTIGRDNTSGHYGIEYAYRSELAGTAGAALSQRIAPGFRGKVASRLNHDPEDGMDIVTTLDVDVQDVADKALREQLQSEGALWGTSLVMECATGDILAMVNLGRNASGQYVENRNYALAARCEPGSTFKLSSVMVLLEDKGWPLSTVYDSGTGRIVEVGPTHVKVQDSHAIEGGVIDMKKAVEQSANVYFAKAIYDAYATNPKRYVDFLRTHLHLDKPMGLTRLGEVSPALRTPGTRNWDKHTSLVNMGYGYAVELAPIHTLTMYNAVANGGRMVAPRLIRELRRNGTTVQDMPVEVLVNKVCSDATLSKIKMCLEDVAQNGTAKAYFATDKVPFRVCAKTGTAKFAQGNIRYDDGYYLGTMVVFLPADKPRYTVLTAIFKRRGTGTSVYGATVAGPVQKQIALFLYNRATDWGATSVAADSTATTAVVSRYPAHIKGGNIAEVRRVANRFAPHVRFTSRYGWGRTEEDAQNNVIVQPLAASASQMPDVRGMGLKDALFLLESRGLRVLCSGAGEVVSQSIAPDTKIMRGQAVSITLQ